MPHLCLGVSNDGSVIAFSRIMPDRSAFVEIVKDDGTSYKTIFEKQFDKTPNIALSPDGKHLAVAEPQDSHHVKLHYFNLEQNAGNWTLVWETHNHPYIDEIIQDVKFSEGKFNSCNIKSKRRKIYCHWIDGRIMGRLSTTLP
jgi:hypothetical protein